MGNTQAVSGESGKDLTATSFDIEQYRSLRGEILRGTEDGNQVMSYGLAAIGLVIAAGIKEMDKILGFVIYVCLIPGLSSLVLSLWVGTLERVARAGYFISGIESRVKKTLDKESPPMWELWLRTKSNGTKNNHFWTTEYTGFALFVFIALLSLGVSLASGGTAICRCEKLIFCGVSFSLEVGFLFWMVGRMRRWRNWLTKSFPS